MNSMHKPLFKIPIPKHFKSIFIVASLTGSAFFLYMLWLKNSKYKRRMRLLNKNTDDEVDVKSICFQTAFSTGGKKNREDCLSVEISNNAQNSVGRIGLNSLLSVINSLENCLENVKAYEESQVTNNSADTAFINELRELLAKSYLLSEKYKQNLLLYDEQFAYDFAEDENWEDDTASFVTAAESLDLSELDYMISSNFHRPLFRDRLRKLDSSEIHSRKMRTVLVGCSSDIEYLAKLDCLRSAFDYVLLQEDVRMWLQDSGKTLSLKLLTCLGCQSKDFVDNYENVFKYLSSTSQVSSEQLSFHTEIKEHYIPVVNFYDIVIDYILLDAFEHLSDPPSSVLSITQNRWLSTSFKRSALESAIWTILTAKRKMLRIPEGFFNFYYNLLGSFVGSLAWGFLGTEESKNKLCILIRKSLVDYIKVIFKFHGEETSASTSGSGDFSSYHSLRMADSNDMISANNSDDLGSPDEYTDYYDDEEASTIINGQINGTGDELNLSTKKVKLDKNFNYAKAHLSPKTKSKIQQPPVQLLKGLRYESLPELAQDLWSATILLCDSINNILDDELSTCEESISFSGLLKPVPVLEWVTNYK